jgi:hypothetical protein
MAADKQQDEGPLSSEALKRDEWRGGETIVQKEDASGHTLPASEHDAAAEDEGRQSSGGIAGTILPPD